MVKRLAIFSLIVVLAGCNLPLAPDDMSERISNDVPRAGVVGSNPRVARAMSEFAADLGAKLEVREGSDHQLVRALEQGRLNVVAPLPRIAPIAGKLG